MELIESMCRLQEAWGDLVDTTEFLRDTPDWMPGLRGGSASQIYDRDQGRCRPVYEIEADLKIIRSACWLLVAKIPMGQAWVNRLGDYTIGTGFDWSVRHQDKTIERALQSLVKCTLDDNNWSSELERESFFREIEDGEWIAELGIIDRQIYIATRECDELTEPLNKRGLEEWLGIDFDASWSFGVLTRRYMTERPVGYHFVRDTGGADWDYLEASKVIHWKRNVRSKCKRGYSDFVNPYTYLQRGDKVFTNTAEGAAIQAAIAYIVEHAPMVTKGQAANATSLAYTSNRVSQFNGQSQRRKEMYAGTRIDVPNGQTYKPGLLGNTNSQIYMEVCTAAIRMGGTVHAFPEGMLTGSYQNANLASSLTAESPFVQGRMTDQLTRAERIRKMIQKIVKLAADRGLLGCVNVRSYEEIAGGMDVEITPSKIVPRDVKGQTEALALQKANGWVDDKTAITELGRDIDALQANGLAAGAVGSTAGTDVGSGSVANTALNGAQVTSLMDVVTQIGTGAMPKASGVAILHAAFPALDPVTINGIVDPIVPGSITAEGGAVPAGADEGGVWMGIKRSEWKNVNKALNDIQTGFSAGTMTSEMAKYLLSSIGVPADKIDIILKDASDGQINDRPPEESTVPESVLRNLNPRQIDIIEAWSTYP